MSLADTELLNFIIARSKNRWTSREAIEREINQMNDDVCPNEGWECKQCGWRDVMIKTCPNCGKQKICHWTTCKGD